MLPARLPNILLNGTTGIAVGMATDIPPHNLREVAKAAITLIGTAETSLDELLDDIVQGPGLPGPKLRSSPRVPKSQNLPERPWLRAHARGVDKRGSGAVVITALPHQVSGAKVLEQIASPDAQKSCQWWTTCAMNPDHENNPTGDRAAL